MSDGIPPDEPKSERFNMFISKSEMDAIEEWAWANRIRSKSDAVRKLVQIGLRVEHHLTDMKAPIFDLMDEVNVIATEWYNVLGEDGKLSAETLNDYNSRVTSIFEMRFDKVEDDVFDAFNILVSAAGELKSINQNSDVGAAVEAADTDRFKAIALIKQLKNDFEKELNQLSKKETDE